MSITRKISKEFRKQATGIGLAAVTAFAPIGAAFIPEAANAQTRAHTTQGEVSDFIAQANRLNNDVLPNRTNADINRTNALYVNYHRFFLHYDGQNYAGSAHNMEIYATALARVYGLERSPEYRHLMTVLDKHSNYAETYLANENVGMAYSGNEGLAGMKFWAIVDIQEAAADFMEQVIPRFNERSASNELHTTFGRACYMTQVMEDVTQQLYESVYSRNGLRYDRDAMTMESNYGRGRHYTCPTPRTNADRQFYRNLRPEL